MRWRPTNAAHRLARYQQTKLRQLETRVRVAERAAYSVYGRCSMDVPSIDHWDRVDMRTVIVDEIGHTVNIKVDATFMFDDMSAMWDATKWLMEASSVRMDGRRLAPMSVHPDPFIRSSLHCFAAKPMACIKVQFTQIAG